MLPSLNVSFSVLKHLPRICFLFCLVCYIYVAYVIILPVYFVSDCDIKYQRPYINKGNELKITLNLLIESIMIKAQSYNNSYNLANRINGMTLFTLTLLSVIASAYFLIILINYYDNTKVD